MSAQLGLSRQSSPPFKQRVVTFNRYIAGYTSFLVFGVCGLFWFGVVYMTPKPLVCGNHTVIGEALDGQGTIATLRRALNMTGFTQVENLVEASQYAGIQPLKGQRIWACLEDGETRIAKINGVQIMG